MVTVPYQGDAHLKAVPVTFDHLEALDGLEMSCRTVSCVYSIRYMSLPRSLCRGLLEVQSFPAVCFMQDPWCAVGCSSSMPDQLVLNSAAT